MLDYRDLDKQQILLICVGEIVLWWGRFESQLEVAVYAHPDRPKKMPPDFSGKLSFWRKRSLRISGSPELSYRIEKVYTRLIEARYIRDIFVHGNTSSEFSREPDAKREPSEKDIVVFYANSSGSKKKKYMHKAAKHMAETLSHSSNPNMRDWKYWLALFRRTTDRALERYRFTYSLPSIVEHTFSELRTLAHEFTDVDHEVDLIWRDNEDEQLRRNFPNMHLPAS